MPELVNERIAVFEDSHQIHSVSGLFPTRVEMKKLVHELFLVINGPDENAARSCLESAARVGLVAGLITAYIGAGIGATGIAFEALKAELIRCLGSSFSVTIKDNSRWEHWTV